MDASHIIIAVLSFVFFCIVSCNGYVISSADINNGHADAALSKERVRRFIESQEFINRPRPGRRELFENSEAGPPRFGKRDVSYDEINNVMAQMKRDIRPRPGRRELSEESEALPPRLGKRDMSCLLYTSPSPRDS